MKIAEISPRTSYTWTGVSVFDIPFPFYRLDSILVTIGSGGTSSTEESLIYITDYTVEGTPASTLDSPIAFINGKVNLTAAGITKASKQAVLTIHRSTAIEQQYGYTELDSFPAASHENALGRAIVILQEVSEKQGRALLTPITSDEVIQYSDLIGIRDTALTATAEATAAAEAASNKAQQAIDASQEATDTSNAMANEVSTALDRIEGIQTEVIDILDNLSTDGVAVLAATQAEMDEGARRNVYASPSTVRGSLAPISDTTSVTKIETPAGAQAKVARASVETAAQLDNLSYNVYTSINDVSNNVAAVKVDIANLIKDLQAMSVTPVTLTSSGSWTPPSTGVYMIHMIGGGGGGGGATTTTGRPAAYGGGGGAGGYNVIFANLTTLTAIPFVIGHGGGQSSQSLSNYVRYYGNGGGATYITVGGNTTGVGGGGGGGTGVNTSTGIGSIGTIIEIIGGGGGAGANSTWGAGTGASGSYANGSGGAGGGHYPGAGGTAANGGGTTWCTPGKSGANGMEGGRVLWGQNIRHGIHYGAGSSGSTTSNGGIVGHAAGGSPGVIFIYYMGGGGVSSDTALTSQVNALAADVASAKTRIDTLSATVTTLSTRTNATAADLVVANSAIARVSADLVTLQVKVSQITGEEGGGVDLESEIEALKASLASVSRYVEDLLSMEIPAINLAATALATRVTKLEEEGTESSEVRDRLGVVESNIEDIDTRVTTLEEGSKTIDLTPIESRLTSAETKVGALQDSLGLANATINNVASDVGTVAASVDTLSARIDTVSSSVNDLGFRVTTLEAASGSVDLTAIETRVTNVETRVGAAETNANNAIASATALSENVGVLTTSVSTVSSNVTSIEAAQAALTSRFDTSLQIMVIQDKKSAHGGTFTTGAWRTRDLNTVAVNTIMGAFLASNQITLPAGAYFIQAAAPAQGVSGHQARLFNVTAGTTLALGQNQFSVDYAYTSNTSTISAYVTLTTSSVIELQHQCQVTAADYGFGSWCGFSEGEVYSTVAIRRIT